MVVVLPQTGYSSPRRSVVSAEDPTASACIGMHRITYLTLIHFYRTELVEHTSDAFSDTVSGGSQ